MTMSDDSAIFSSRRGILVSAVAAAVPVVSGCGIRFEHSDRGGPAPGPDELARTTVASTLADAYAVTDRVDAPHRLAGLVEQIRIMLAGQLAALNEPAEPTPGSTSAPASRPPRAARGQEPTLKSVARTVAAVRDDSRKLVT